MICLLVGYPIAMILAGNTFKSTTVLLEMCIRDRFGTASLSTRLINDVNQLQLAVAMLIRLVVRAPFLAIGAVIMAMLLDLKLSVVFLVATPLIVLTLAVITAKSVPYFKKMQGKLDRVSQITRESLSGARVIRAFSKQKDEQTRLDLSLIHLFDPKYL